MKKRLQQFILFMPLLGNILSVIYLYQILNSTFLKNNPSIWGLYLIFMTLCIMYNASKCNKIYFVLDEPSTRLYLVITIKILFSPIAIIIITISKFRFYAKCIKDGHPAKIFEEKDSSNS